MKTNAWKDVTLAEFSQIRAILNDEGRDSEEKMIGLAAVLQGVDEDTILEMPLDKVAPIFEMVQGLDKKPEPAKVRKTYLLNGWTLKVSDKTMTLAQWIDFQNYARDGFEDHLGDILSVVLIPEGKKYNEDYDMALLKRDLQLFSVGDALAVCFFFQRRWLKLMRRTLNYWVGWSAMKGQKEARKTFLALRREISAIHASL